MPRLRSACRRQPVDHAQVVVFAHLLQKLLGLRCLALTVPHGGVEPILGEQVRMRAALGDHAAFQHDDLVSADHGRKAMGDDQRGAVLRNDIEGRLDLALGRRVQRRGRLVEDQNRRRF